MLSLRGDDDSILYKSADSFLPCFTSLTFELSLQQSVDMNISHTIHNMTLTFDLGNISDSIELPGLSVAELGVRQRRVRQTAMLNVLQA